MRLRCCWLTSIVLTALLLVGCDDAEMEITLNPNGTAKVVYRVSRPLDMLVGAAVTELPEETARRFANDLLAQSSGVAAWKDVSFGYDPETQRIRFQGTAYCNDLNGLRFHAGMDMRKADLRLKYLRTPQGIELVLQSWLERPIDARRPKLPEERLERHIAAMKLRANREWPAVAATVKTMRHAYVVHFPAGTTRLINFSAGATPNSATLAYRGEAIAEAVPALLADDQFWRENASPGPWDSGPEQLRYLNERLFGTRDNARIIVEGELKPLFDYEAECQAALRSFEPMVRQLGLDVRVLPPATGEGFQRLSVGGVRWIREADFEAGINAYHGFPGYSLTLVGEFTGAVFAVGEVKVETLIADTGQSLRTEETYRRAPQLSKDRQTVTFDLQLATPEPGIDGWRLIAGHLVYTVVEGTTEHDFGVQPLKVGKLAGPLPLTIRSVGETYWAKDRQQMELDLDLTGLGPLKEVRLYGADGAPVELEPLSRLATDERPRVTLLAKGAMPAAGRLVIVTHAKAHTYKAPFVIENLDLLGRPRAR